MSGMKTDLSPFREQDHAARPRYREVDVPNRKSNIAAYPDMNALLSTVENDERIVSVYPRLRKSYGYPDDIIDLKALIEVVQK